MKKPFLTDHQTFALIILALFIFIGPLFGPVPSFLLKMFDLELAAILLVILFFISFSAIFLIVNNYIRFQKRSIFDLGWRRDTTFKAVLLGCLLGVLWSFLGVGGYLQLNPGVDIFEISFLRIGTVILGCSGAILEDLITRGYVMNELNRFKISSSLQIVFSSCLFALYHTIWNFNILGFIFSLIYGMLLGGLFIYGRRSLTPVILGHSLVFLLSEPFLTLFMLESIQ